MARLNQDMLKEFWSRQQAVSNIQFGGNWGALLECDFRIIIERPQLPTLTSDDWILSSVDVKGAQLSWSPDDGLFGWPMPKVSASACSLTFLTKSQMPLYGEDKSVGDILKLYYEAQFNAFTGLLEIPKRQLQTTITFQVKGEYASGVTTDEFGDGRFPFALFKLQGVRFGTPTFTANPTTLNGMAVGVPFSYRNTLWRDFTTQGYSLLIPSFEINETSLLNKPLYFTDDN